MRALAEFIMRGRLQAGVVALFSVAIPLFPLAAVSLVTLRRGSTEGLLMVLVGLIPAILVLLIDNPQSVMIFGSALMGLLMAYLPAVTLRATVSWRTAIIVCTVATLILVPLAMTLFPGLVGEFAEMAAVIVAGGVGQSASVQSLPEPSSVAVSGFMAVAFWLNGLSALLLARWWQAALFNPGGFGQEFCELRLGWVVSLLLGVAVVACYSQNRDYLLWAVLFALPLIVVALSVIHSAARYYGTSRLWLVVFYCVIVMVNPLLLLLALLGLLDSWLNIRNRYLRNKDKQ